MSAGWSTRTEGRNPFGTKPGGPDQRSGPVANNEIRSSAGADQRGSRRNSRWAADRLATALFLEVRSLPGVKSKARTVLSGQQDRFEWRARPRAQFAPSESPDLLELQGRQGVRRDGAASAAGRRRADRQILATSQNVSCGWHRWPMFRCAGCTIAAAIRGRENRPIGRAPQRQHRSMHEVWGTWLLSGLVKGWVTLANPAEPPRAAAVCSAPMRRQPRSEGGNRQGWVAPSPRIANSVVVSTDFGSSWAMLAGCLEHWSAARWRRRV